MRPDLQLWIPAATLGAAWAVGASWRAPGGTLRTALRGLLGGGAAAGLATSAFGLLQAAGYEARWEEMVRGGWGPVALACIIGLVEEGSKFLGILLASEGRPGLIGALRTTTGVAAGFAALEAAMTLQGVSLPLALGRAALAPMAHLLLALPLAAGAAAPGRWGLRLAGALVAAALLHGAADWGLSLAHGGPAVYAGALLAPTLWFFVRARRALGWPMPWERTLHSLPVARR